LGKIGKICFKNIRIKGSGMNYLKLVFILSVLVGSLSAKERFIKISTVENRGMLLDISYKLNNLGYKMYATKYKGYYRVYTGPFDSYYKADKALKELQKEISKDAIIVDLKVEEKNHNFIRSQDAVVPEMRYKYGTSHTKGKYFMGLSLGRSNFSVDDNNISGALVYTSKLQDRAISYSAEFGYYLRDNIDIAFEYKYLNFESIHINSLYISSSYHFDKTPYISPYITLLFGYSTLDWEADFMSRLTSDTESSKFGFGIGLGTTLYENDKFSVNLFYRYLDLGNTTKLSTTEGRRDIVYNNEQSFNLGVRYGF
jgi:opacity protein-like surface antigen